jgi:hypothetical protein
MPYSILLERSLVSRAVAIEQHAFAHVLTILPSSIVLGNGAVYARQYALALVKVLAPVAFIDIATLVAHDSKAFAQVVQPLAFVHAFDQ